MFNTTKTIINEIKNNRTASHLTTPVLLKLYDKLKDKNKHSYVVDRVICELMIRKVI